VPLFWLSFDSILALMLSHSHRVSGTRSEFLLQRQMFPAGLKVWFERFQV